MEDKQILLTSEGLKKLEEELEYLKTEKRKEVAEKIKHARGFGDLSENSEYDEAKDEQAKVEQRIAEIEKMLKNVKVIGDDDIDLDVAGVGSKIRIYDYDFDEEATYTIVGSTEADPENGKISDESPIGKALLGKSAEDVVDVETPGGIIKLKILEIGR